jgi:FMNH2-dependent dimethyl sulfone monooxygenase
MRLGIFAPVPHSIRPDSVMARAIEELGTLGGEGVDLSFRYTLEVLTRAEAHGFDISLVAERFLGPDLESWVLASALAARTSRIQIMPAVHPGMITPQVAAKMAASLDRISGGRVALNVVNGWFEEEFTAFSNGAWLDGSAARYRRMDEFIQVLKGLWTQERFSFAGEFYQLEGGRLPTRSMRQPHPGLYAASRSDAGKEIMARECDMAFLAYQPDYRLFEENLRKVAADAADMRARAARYGRSIGCGLNPQVVMGDSMEEAAAKAADFELFGTRDRISRVSAAALGVGLVGTPAVIAERIRQYESVGVGLMMLRFHPMLEGLEEFAAKVLPLLGPRLSAAAE